MLTFIFQFQGVFVLFKVEPKPRTGNECTEPPSLLTADIKNIWMRAVQGWSGLAVAIMHQADWFESKMMLTFQLSLFSVWLKVQRQVQPLGRGKVSPASSGAQSCPGALQPGKVLFYFTNIASLSSLFVCTAWVWDSSQYPIYPRSRLMVDSLAVWARNSSQSNLSTSKVMLLWFQAYCFFFLSIRMQVR